MISAISCKVLRVRMADGSSKADEKPFKTTRDCDVGVNKIS